MNLLPRLAADEKVLDMIAVREFDERRSIVFATKLGKIKRTRLDAFKRPNVRGIRAIALNPSDELVEVAAGYYLGKAHLRVRGHWRTVAYFALQPGEPESHTHAM